MESVYEDYDKPWQTTASRSVDVGRRRSIVDRFSEALPTWGSWRQRHQRPPLPFPCLDRNLFRCLRAFEKLVSMHCGIALWKSNWNCYNMLQCNMNWMALDHLGRYLMVSVAGGYGCVAKGTCHRHCGQSSTGASAFSGSAGNRIETFWGRAVEKVTHGDPWWPM